MWVACAAAALAAALAWPVVRSPSTRVFGAEIVGRHHDPFTVMRQFAGSINLGLYAQPLTDAPGALIARLTGGIAAYNWLVLLTFPLAAATAFLLARHLDLSRGAAAFSALAFAFSPFHVAQSAYHPHIAQVQWVPVYLLALWASLDRWSPLTAAGLALATVGVTLSNFYGGLIAAVITPVALGAYWVVRARATPRAWRSLAGTGATLVLLAGAGLAYVSLVAPAVLGDPASVAMNRADLFSYSAKWWGYLVPPVVNPWAGRFALHIWKSADVGAGLLEQQVTLGAGVVGLGLVAIGTWLARRGAPGRVWAVPVLATVAFAALVCSLSPERMILGVRVVRPSAWLYAVAPMFRSYARFGVVVQLMGVLLAGLGLDTLRQAREMGRLVAVLLVALVAVEYAASPAALSRDVLPTPAHRWLLDHDAAARALDCVPPDAASASIPWLSDDRIAILGGAVTDCDAPHLSDQLAALGFTHLIVRRTSPIGRGLDTEAAPAGLRRVRAIRDGEIFQVIAPKPPLYTGGMPGFFPREFSGGETWRWMSERAGWQVVNTTPAAMHAGLRIELQAFLAPRHLEIQLDGRTPQDLLVDPARRWYELTPLTVPPGSHMLTFRVLDPPTVVDAATHNGDPRALSVAVGGWDWSTVRGS